MCKAAPVAGGDTGQRWPRCRDRALVPPPAAGSRRLTRLRPASGGPWDSRPPHAHARTAPHHAAPLGTVRNIGHSSLQKMLSKSKARAAMTAHTERPTSRRSVSVKTCAWARAWLTVLPCMVPACWYLVCCF